MAKTLLSSTLNPFLPSSSSSSSSKTQITTLKAFSKNNPKLSLSDSSCLLCNRRELSLGFMMGFLVGGGRGKRNANAAILEADDDEELLERVKKDRKKRIERQGVISSSDKEKGYLQDLVYKLSKVGQAIENNDLTAANSVLGGTTDSEWVKMVNMALTKLSSNPKEKTQVDTFNSSLASLITSVNKNDIASSKLAFVSSATAFETWASLTGLIGQLRGL